MAKVQSDEPDGILYQDEWLTIRAVPLSDGSFPAKEWADGLDKKGKGQLQAAGKIISNSLRDGRPFAGRLTKMKESKVGVLELRVTLAGGKPPHHRLFCVREGNTLWATHGFTKKTNKTPRKEVDAAGSHIERWRQTRRR